MSTDTKSAPAPAEASPKDTIRKPFPITMRTGGGTDSLEQEDAPTEVMERPSRERLLSEQD